MSKNSTSTTKQFEDFVFNSEIYTQPSYHSEKYTPRTTRGESKDVA